VSCYDYHVGCYWLQEALQAAITRHWKWPNTEDICHLVAALEPKSKLALGGNYKLTFLSIDPSPPKILQVGPTVYSGGKYLLIRNFELTRRSNVV
jgi:hypothetical protein